MYNINILTIYTFIVWGIRAKFTSEFIFVRNFIIFNFSFQIIITMIIKSKK